MQQVVVLENPHGTSPFQRGQSGLYRTSQRVIERQQARCLPRPEDEVGEPLRTIGEGADDELFGEWP